MSRNKWTPEARILRATEPDRGGPAYRSVLVALAEHHGAADGKKLITGMIESGRLHRYGMRRATRYGHPPKKSALRVR